MTGTWKPTKNGDLVQLTVYLHTDVVAELESYLVQVNQFSKKRQIRMGHLLRHCIIMGLDEAQTYGPNGTADFILKEFKNE